MNLEVILPCHGLHGETKQYLNDRHIIIIIPLKHQTLRTEINLIHNYSLMFSWIAWLKCGQGSLARSDKLYKS